MVTWRTSSTFRTTLLRSGAQVPTFRYECLVTIQRPQGGAPSFCLFHAPAGEILEWADIKRLEEEAGAPQRRTSPAKVKAIRRFLEKDQRNTIPTSVVLTIEGSPDRLPALRDDPNTSFRIL